MLHTALTVTLNHTNKQYAQDQLRSRFRSQTYFEGHRETTSALVIIEGIARALNEASITNVISLQVDQSTVYIDTNNEPDDLEDMITAAQESPALEQPYELIHLIASHEVAGLRFMLDLTMDIHQMRRHSTFTLDLTGRVLDLQIMPGETAEAYTSRLRTWAADDAEIERYRSDTEKFVDILGQVLDGALSAANIDIEPVVIRLVKPTKKQLSQLRNASFGDNAQETRFREVRADFQEQQKRQSQRSRRRHEAPASFLIDEEEFEPQERRNKKNRRDRDRSDREHPSKGERGGKNRGRKEQQQRRPGATKQQPTDKRAKRRLKQARKRQSTQQNRALYSDTYSTYFYDPYWDFASLVLLDAVHLHQSWQLPYVQIHNAWGDLLGPASNATEFLQDDPLIGFEGALSFDNKGGIVFDDIIPSVLTFDDGYYGDYALHHTQDDEFDEFIDDDFVGDITVDGSLEDDSAEDRSFDEDSGFDDSEGLTYEDEEE